MKATKRLVLLVVVFFTIQPVYAQIESADLLIHKAFTALKTKNEKAFLALYPNGQQFSKVMRMIMEQMLKFEEMKEMIQADEKSTNINIDSFINV